MTTTSASGSAAPSSASQLIPPTPGCPPPSDGTKPSTFKRWLKKKGQPSAEGQPKIQVALPPVDLLLKAIEPGVAIPAVSPRAAQYHAVWVRMAVGDSVPLDSKVAKRLTANAQAWGKQSRPGEQVRKFVMRPIDAGTSRIWRTE